VKDKCKPIRLVRELKTLKSLPKIRKQKKAKKWKGSSRKGIIENGGRCRHVNSIALHCLKSSFFSSRLPNTPPHHFLTSNPHAPTLYFSFIIHQIISYHSNLYIQLNIDFTFVIF